MFRKTNIEDQNIKECYLCGKETNYICKECKKPVCELHIKLPEINDSNNKQSILFCERCYQKLEKQKTHSFRRVFFALTILILVIAIIIIIYELAF